MGSIPNAPMISIGDDHPVSAGVQLISFGILGMQFVNLRKEIIKVQARLRRMLRDRDAS